MNNCKQCGEPTKTIFCSSSCSAKFNNKLRTLESREKQRRTICDTLNVEYKPKINRKRNPLQSAIKQNMPFTYVNQCTWCSKYFDSKMRKSTTCSDYCYMKVKLVLNAGLKVHYYKNIRMESGWEVKLAEYLDNKNVSWVRPEKYIEWYDSKNKFRQYYPDFYLPDLDLYLDPKNPIAMMKQKEKVDYFKEHTNIIIDGIEEIIEKLEKIIP